MNKLGYDEKCAECGSQEIVLDPQKGELICFRCGVVADVVIDSGPEWRAYSSEEENQRSRSGAPISYLRADLGLPTAISRSRKDGQGQSLPLAKRYEYERLSHIDNRTLNSHIRNLRTALRELKRIRSLMELPETVGEEASIIYRRCLKANKIRGRSIEGMIAACLYIACRNAGLPHTLRDMILPTNIQMKELGRCVRIIIGELDLRPTPSDYVALVHRLGDALNVTMHTRSRAVEIIGEAKSNGITVGKNPMSMAAAALYIAGVQTGERRTQQQIAKVAKTTPVTIRNRFKELVAALAIKDVDVKRGAAAVPVYMDPQAFLDR
ncbi:MAG: transcription initiation factor IIB family protein [Candidatus Heimdallarchaeota archaeon]